MPTKRQPRTVYTTTEKGNEWLDEQLVSMGLPPIGDMSKEVAFEYMEDILKAHREWLIKNGPQE